MYLKDIQFALFYTIHMIAYTTEICRTQTITKHPAVAVVEVRFHWDGQWCIENY